MTQCWHTSQVAVDGPVEYVDLVDANDNVVGRVTRGEMRAGILRHRAVFVAVTSPDGKLLIHRRSDIKDLWPGWWDIAVGGVVAAGETYGSAVRRELAEEVGIDNGDPVFLGSGAYDDADVSLIGHCYHLVHSGPIEARDGEVAEFLWVDLPELRGRLDRDRFLPDSVSLLLPDLFTRLS
jgi:8-oxo-dGTP pyrophosphatase MutT (NUDIX family)